MLYYYTS